MTIIRVTTQSELSNDFNGAYNNCLLIWLGRIKYYNQYSRSTFKSARVVRAHRVYPLVDSRLPPVYLVYPPALINFLFNYRLVN
jgi:hypothetical protein